MNLRQQVLERDNYTCCECGTSDKKLETHHKVARRYGGKDEIDNIITLCRKCHRIIEPPSRMGPITNPSYRPVGHLSLTIYETSRKRLDALALGMKHMN